MSNERIQWIAAHCEPDRGDIERNKLREPLGEEIRSNGDRDLSACCCDRTRRNRTNNDDLVARLGRVEKKLAEVIQFVASRKVKD